MGIRIAGTGSYVPEKILTNADLEKMVETNDEWIRTRTGIQERRIAAAGQTTGEMAYQASLRAMTMAGITGEDLDAIIVATITPDYIFPGVGCLLQHRLGAGHAFCFDLEAACSGFLYSFEVAHSLMAAQRKYKHVLVIGAEKLSCITDWTDRNTCILFGDGAGAVILENTDDEMPDCLLASDLHSDGGYTDVLNLPGGGSRNPASAETVAKRLHFVHMEGRETFKMAVNGMVSSCNKVLTDTGTAGEEIKVVIPHQANLRIIDAVAHRIPVPEGRMFTNIHRYGNTSAASIGICLDEVVRGNLLNRGDHFLLTSFGGGLTWGALLLRY